MTAPPAAAVFSGESAGLTPRTPSLTKRRHPAAPPSTGDTSWRPKRGSSQRAIRDRKNKHTREAVDKSGQAFHSLQESVVDEEARYKLIAAQVPGMQTYFEQRGADQAREAHNRQVAESNTPDAASIQQQVAQAQRGNVSYRTLQAIRSAHGGGMAHFETFKGVSVMHSAPILTCGMHCMFFPDIGTRRVAPKAQTDAGFKRHRTIAPTDVQKVRKSLRRKLPGLFNVVMEPRVARTEEERRHHVRLRRVEARVAARIAREAAGRADESSDDEREADESSGDEYALADQSFGAALRDVEQAIKEVLALHIASNYGAPNTIMSMDKFAHAMRTLAPVWEKHMETREDPVGDADPGEVFQECCVDILCCVHASLAHCARADNSHHDLGQLRVLTVDEDTGEVTSMFAIKVWLARDGIHFKVAEDIVLIAGGDGKDMKKFLKALQPCVIMLVRPQLHGVSPPVGTVRKDGDEMFAEDIRNDKVAGKKMDVVIQSVDSGKDVHVVFRGLLEKRYQAPKGLEQLLDKDEFDTKVPWTWVSPANLESGFWPRVDMFVHLKPRLAIAGDNLFVNKTIYGAHSGNSTHSKPEVSYQNLDGA